MTADVGVVLDAVAATAEPVHTESYLAERAARADVPRALAILKRARDGAPPVEGDDLID